MKRITVGFVGFGEVNTPREFIDARCAAVAADLRKEDIEVIVTAPVADDPAGAGAARAVSELSARDVDALVICIAGWIPSWAVFAVIEPFRHKPMVLLGLTGWREGERFITTADQAGTTALRLPMAEMGYTFNYVVTSRGGAVPVAKVATYCRAAAAAARLRKARIGMAGYRDMRLYGTLYDGISLKGRIGPEIEHFDLLELRDLMESVGGDEVEAFSREVKARWIFMREPRAGTIENSVRLSLAIRRKIEDRGYSAFSFSDVDGVKKLMKFAPAGALTLLHDQISLPTIPENDSLGSVTQLMVHYLTGQVGAYLEFYEFMENGVMMGVPDYVPAEIVDGRVTVLPNAFGSFGEGLLNVSAIKTGRVTLARLGMAGGDYRMHVVTGEAQRPILWEEAGWAPPAPRLPSLDIVIDGSMEDFTGKVMGQHYILSYGDNREGLSDLCSILGIERV